MYKISTPEEVYKSIIGSTPSEIDQHPYTVECMQAYAKEVVKYTLEQAVEKAKTTPLYRPNCDDHTPYWGVCQSCGSYDNPDVLVGEIVDEQSILSLEDQIIKDLKL